MHVKLWVSHIVVRFLLEKKDRHLDQWVYLIIKRVEWFHHLQTSYVKKVRHTIHNGKITTWAIVGKVLPLKNDKKILKNK